MIREGALVLADGSVFEGELIGADRPVATGEVVFNTVLSGYQEVITDPSYAGQIITFTTPHIGNYGTNANDDESRSVFCRGVVIRELARRHSNHRAESGLATMLEQRGLPGIAGIDTRRLTRLLRDRGALPGAFGSVSEADLLAAANHEPGTDGVDLVDQVTIDAAYTVPPLDPENRTEIVAVDFGMKRNIAVNLSRLGRVDVVPASTTAADILARQPDGVFLSNGPGDPAMVPYAVETIRDLLGRVPIFGICLGHQLTALASGASTYKLKFGHRSHNQPVLEVGTDKAYLSSQNHGYAVDNDSIKGDWKPYFTNLNDGSNEGLKHVSKPIFTTQFHPEASSGPTDTAFLFGEFIRKVKERKKGE